MHTLFVPGATQPSHAAACLLACLGCFAASVAASSEVQQPGVTEKTIQEVTLAATFERLVYRPGEPIKLTLHYTNHGTYDVPVLVAFRTPLGNHFDQLRIVIRDIATTRTWSLVPADVRDAVEPFGCIIAPGATLSQPLDLTHWLDRIGNKLPPGDYSVEVTYQAEEPVRAVFHPALCAPLLDAPPQFGVEDGARLDCNSGPFRSEPIALRLVAR